MQRYHHEARNFEDARDICQGQDSDLVIINSPTENKYIYDMANRDQVDVWLGIRENVSTFLDLIKHFSGINFLIYKTYFMCFLAKCEYLKRRKIISVLKRLKQLSYIV